MLVRVWDLEDPPLWVFWKKKKRVLAPQLLRNTMWVTLSRACWFGLCVNSSGVSRCYAYKPYIYEFIRTMHEWMCKCGVSGKSDKRKKWHHENRKMFFTKKFFFWRRNNKKMVSKGVLSNSTLLFSSYLLHYLRLLFHFLNWRIISQGKGKESAKQKESTEHISKFSMKIHLRTSCYTQKHFSFH